MKRKPKRPKALWYRALHGDKPKKKKPGNYPRAVARWKRGKQCVCAGMEVTPGLFVCEKTEHPCQDNHHRRGRLGALLMDQTHWLAVCRKAHIFIHQHPNLSISMGLLAGLGEWNVPPKETI